MKKHRRLKIWLLAALGLVIILVLAGPRIMAPILRSRLQSMVSSCLNAELRIGEVTYQFPYGVTVDDAALVVTDEDGQQNELLKADRIELALAELPGGSGPLVIEKLILDRPRLNLIHTRHGFAGEHGLLKDSLRGTKPTNSRLSDMFRLRRFKIDDAQIVYIDRQRPGDVPMVWKNLQIDLNTNPKAGVIYGYTLDARNLPLLEAAASGTMNIDDLVVDLQTFGLKLQVDPRAQQSQLPGQLQELLRQYRIDGVLRATGSAHLPLCDLGSAGYDATIDLSGTSGLPQWNAALDRMTLQLRCSSNVPAEDRESQARDAATTQASAVAQTVAAATTTVAPDATQPAGIDLPSVYVRIGLLEIGSRDTILRVENGHALLDPQARRWLVRKVHGTLSLGRDRAALPTALAELLGDLDAQGKLEFTARANGPLPGDGARASIDDVDYELMAFPRGLKFQPRGFVAPIDIGGGTLHLLTSQVKLQNIDARYGDDKFFITTCRLPLQNVDKQLRIEDLDASATIAANSPAFPKPLNKTMDALHPVGEYFLKGRIAVVTDAIATTRPVEDADVDYDLHIASEHGEFRPGDGKMPLSDVKLDLALQSGAAQIRRLEAKSCGAFVSATGELMTGKVFAYKGKVQIHELDMKDLAGRLSEILGDPPMRLSGKGYLVAAISGTGPRDERTMLDNFRAKGEFEVLDGDFWQVPVLSEIVAGSKVARDAMTVGQAAGSFDLFDRKVVLDNAAVSSPVLGIQGSGEVHFDGQIDAKAVAAPLADWRDKIRRTNIPLVSAAAGELAGGLQKLINGATGKLFYQFRITGTAAKPRVTTVPAPILTESAASLFASMLNLKKDDHLLQVMRKDKPADNK